MSERAEPKVTTTYMVTINGWCYRVNKRELERVQRYIERGERLRREFLGYLVFLRDRPQTRKRVKRT